MLLLFLYSLILAPCVSELDISIIDRLNAVFHGDPFTDDQGIYSSDDIDLQKNNQPKFTFTIEASSIEIRLRFPCTDLRPIHAPDRVPWWKRNVLRDSLYFNFSTAKIIYMSPCKYDIIANKIDIFYSVCRYTIIQIKT